METNKFLLVVFIVIAVYAICAVLFVYRPNNRKTSKIKSKVGEGGFLSDQDNDQLIKIVDIGNQIGYNEIVDYVIRYDRIKDGAGVVQEIEKLENINFSEYSNLLNIKTKSYGSL